MSEDKQISAARKILARYLASHGMRSTYERTAILDVVATTPGHFSINDTIGRIGMKGIIVSPATVYNNFKLYCDAGILRRHCIDERVIVYEFVGGHDSTAEHIHLVCLECGEVRDIKESPVNLFMQEARLPYRFSARYAEYYIYGLCARCQRRQKSANSHKATSAKSGRKHAPCTATNTKKQENNSIKSNTKQK